MQIAFGFPPHDAAELLELKILSIRVVEFPVAQAERERG